MIAFHYFQHLFLQTFTMCSLRGFPPVPPVGHVTLCEVDGRVHSLPAEQADVHIFTNAVSFPKLLC